jgi:hypothetical protein
MKFKLRVFPLFFSKKSRYTNMPLEKTPLFRNKTTRTFRSLCIVQYLSEIRRYLPGMCS